MKNFIKNLLTFEILKSLLSMLQLTCSGKSHSSCKFKSIVKGDTHIVN